MNFGPLTQQAGAALSAHPLLARLVLMSLELALWGAAVALCIACFRLRAPRLRALLWLLVLAKPIISAKFKGAKKSAHQESVGQVSSVAAQGSMTIYPAHYHSALTVCRNLSSVPGG